MYYFHTAFLLSMLFIIILVPERNAMYKRKWV